jgi:hypothetical protein
MSASLAFDAVTIGVGLAFDRRRWRVPGQCRWTQMTQATVSHRRSTGGAPTMGRCQPHSSSSDARHVNAAMIIPDRALRSASSFDRTTDHSCVTRRLKSCRHLPRPSLDSCAFPLVGPWANRSLRVDQTSSRRRNRKGTCPCSGISSDLDPAGSQAIWRLVAHFAPVAVGWVDARSGKARPPKNVPAR